MDSSQDYYCPKTFDKLERLSGCGSIGYFCDTCKSLISRKEMLTAEQVAEKKREMQEKQDVQAESQE